MINVIKISYFIAVYQQTPENCLRYVIICSMTNELISFVSFLQACIEDNLDMVEFLVSRGADVNRKDNEGWTPLHATSSCG
jgi:ankyrin repeat protein